MRPDPDQARSWLEAELARPEYHDQSLLERFLAWLDGLWLRLTFAASAAGELSTFVAVGLAVLMAGLALLVLPRIRRTPTPRAGRGAVLPDQAASADEHRARAEAARADGRFDEAVVEAMRALTRRLVDRGVIDDTPGSTAHEIALATGEAFPQDRGRLLAAADLFDEVQYGDVDATSEEATWMLALDDDLRTARPSSLAGAAPRTRAVPR